MTRELPLTQGKVAIVDDWRFAEFDQWQWCAWYDPHTKGWYARRAEGKGKERKTILLHREVAHTPTGMICDHKNHNTLDCQEQNLRNVTHSQNMMNKHFKPGKLGERCIHQERNGYRVAIRKEGKYVFNKRFDYLPEAIIARDAALKKYHGEFLYNPHPTSPNSHKGTMSKSMI